MAGADGRRGPWAWPRSVGTLVGGSAASSVLLFLVRRRVARRRQRVRALASSAPFPAVIARRPGRRRRLPSLGSDSRRGPPATLDRAGGRDAPVEDGDYSVRVEPPTSSGLRSGRAQLAAGFDTMAARLETDERQRRTLLADVSHELRTPLAVVTGQPRGDPRRRLPAPTPSTSASILDETRVLARLIDDLRTLALSEAGTLALHREPTDPDVLVGEVVRSFEAAADGRRRRAVDRDRRATCRSSMSTRSGSARSSRTSSRTRSATRPPAAGSRSRARSSGGRWLRLEVARHGRRHRPGAPAPRLRPVRQGRRVTRLRAGPGDRPAAGRGPRRRDLGAIGRGLGHDDPGSAAAYGRVIRTSSTAASTVLPLPRSAACEHDPDRLTGPRAHRHADRRPGRQVGVRGAVLRT